MSDMKAVRDAVHALVRESFHHEFGKSAHAVPANAEWAKVRATGTRLWLDTGDLDEATKLFTKEFQALTTNNTLLNNEVQKGIYDELVGEAAKVIRAAAPDISRQDLVLEIAFVLNAYHGLRLVHQFDAFVSVELHTDLAHDVARSVEYGRRYFAICPERFVIKIPFTPAGLLSSRIIAREGIPVNFTLGFSARQNYLAALLSNTAYVNVFMGRLNAVVSDHKLGSGDNVGEKATLATQRALIALREAGRSKTCLIGASMRSGAQVATLAGLDIFTMPPKVAAGYIKAPVATVTSHVADDPDVPLADGVKLEDFDGASLWEVTDAFKQAVEALLARDLDALTPDDVIKHFACAGFGGFMPDWTLEEAAIITKDGKIPNIPTWKDRLASGKLGLDALMNAAALHSFIVDQTAFDNRVRSLI